MCEPLVHAEDRDLVSARPGAELVAVRLGAVRLVAVRLGAVRLGAVRLGAVRIAPADLVR